MKDRSIYVAGGGLEREVAAEYIARLRAAGFTVTYDWTTSPGWTRALTEAEDLEQARLDYEAVLAAGTVWYLAPREKSEGSHFELGVAVARGRNVVVSGEQHYHSRRIFPLLVGERYATHEEAFEAIVAGLSLPWSAPELQLSWEGPELVVRANRSLPVARDLAKWYAAQRLDERATAQGRVDG